MSADKSHDNELLYKSVRDNVERVLKKMNVEYNKEDLQTITMTSDGIDLGSVLHNSDAKITEELVKEFTSNYGNIMIESKSNICETSKSTDGNIMIKTGGHLQGVCDGIINSTDETVRDGIRFLKAEYGSHYHTTASHGFGDETLEPLSDNTGNQKEEGVEVKKPCDYTIDLGGACGDVEISDCIRALAITEQEKTSPKIGSEEPIKKGDRVALYSMRQDKASLDVILLAVVQAISRRSAEYVTSGGISPQKHINFMDHLLRLMGFDTVPAVTKAEKKVGQQLIDAGLFVKKNILTPADDDGKTQTVKKNRITKKAKIKIKDEATSALNTLKPIASAFRNDLDKILGETSHELAMNNGLNGAGQLTIHEVVNSKFAAIEKAKKLQAEGHDAHLCKVGSTVDIIHMVDYSGPSTKYLSANASRVRLALIRELLDIYKIFKVISQQAGGNDESIKNAVPMIWNTMIEKSDNVLKIIAMDPSFDHFDDIREAIGEERMRMISYFIEVGCTIMSRETGYRNGIELLYRIIGGNPSKIRWLPPHTDSYKRPAAATIKGMVNMVHFLENDTMLASHVCNDMPIVPRGCTSLYRLIMLGVKHKVYSENLLRMPRETIAAIAARHLDFEESVALNQLINKVVGGCVSADVQHLGMLNSGLAPISIEKMEEDLAHYNFIANTLLGTWLSLPLAKAGDFDNYTERLLRVNTRAAKSVMSLYDRSINITDKNMILTPIVAMMQLLDKASGASSSFKGLVNKVDSELLALPLNWYMKMFCSAADDEEVSDMLIALLVLKNLTDKETFNTIYKGFFDVMVKGFDAVKARPFLAWLNDYSPNVSDQIEEEDDESGKPKKVSKIQPEELIETIKISPFGDMFKVVKSIWEEIQRENKERAVAEAEAEAVQVAAAESARIRSKKDKKPEIPKRAVPFIRAEEA